MKKRDYFIQALNDEAYRYKAWVIHCFSITNVPENETIPWRLHRGDQSYYFFAEGEEEPTYLEDTDVSKPPFHYRETLTITPDEVKNLNEEVETKYGQLLVNAIALIYPLGDKIAYVNGEFNIKKVEEEIAARLTTDVQYQDEYSKKPDNPIYVSEYLDFIDAFLSMEGYSQICVPSATEKTMTGNPDIPKRRDELLEENKDRLTDPAVIAQIEAELIQMDREWMKGDLGEGFYRKSKSYEVVRKKTHSMYGFESGFGLKPATINKALAEGWDMEKLPAMINALREGSYGRGKMTEKGGEATKNMNRVMQNTEVLNEDCGATLGWSKEVDDSQLGFYYINTSGNTVLIDENNIERLRGRTVSVRSPQFCHTKPAKYCRYCVGEPNGENVKALSAHAAALTSQLMSISMSSAHAVALKTSKYDKLVCIR